MAISPGNRVIRGRMPSRCSIVAAFGQEGRAFIQPSFSVAVQHGLGKCCRADSYRGGDMKWVLTVLAAATIIAAAAAPASADAHRSGKGPAMAGHGAGKPYGYYGGAFTYGPPPA